MAECSLESFIHTRIQKLIYLHLFMELFCKDFSSFIRTKTESFGRYINIQMEELGFPCLC